MAQAADSPIGFLLVSKDLESGISQPRDISLAELHEHQASPDGMIAAHVVALVSTFAELKNLSASPVGLRLLTAELPDLELVHTEIGQLISRIYRSQGIAA
jgi:hypothetical protein